MYKLNSVTSLKPSYHISISLFCEWVIDPKIYRSDLLKIDRTISERIISVLLVRDNIKRYINRYK